MAGSSDIRPDDAHGIGEAREGIALTSALALDRRAMLESLQLVVDRATQQPRAVVETAGRCATVGITFGSSDRTLERRRSSSFCAIWFGITFRSV